MKKVLGQKIISDHSRSSLPLSSKGRRIFCAASLLMILCSVLFYCFKRTQPPYYIGIQGKTSYSNWIPFADIPITLRLIPRVLLEKLIFFSLLGVLCQFFVCLWKGKNWRFRHWCYIFMAAAIMIVIEFFDACFSEYICFDVNNIVYYSAGFLLGSTLFPVCWKIAACLFSLLGRKRNRKLKIHIANN